VKGPQQTKSPLLLGYNICLMSVVDSSFILFTGINAVIVGWEWKNRIERRGKRRRQDNDDEHDANKQNDRHDHSVADRPKLLDDVQVDLPSHLQRELYKDRRRKESVPRLARKSPLYDNYRMFGPDGRTLLCTTSAKKARWYVRKGLAEWWQRIDGGGGGGDDDKTIHARDSDTTTTTTSIRLLFTPKNEKRQEGQEKEVSDVFTKLHDDDNDENHDTISFRRTRKDNICVVCGASDGLMKYYVVPHSYRRKLPQRYKSHHSHDIVLLCVPCHVIADRDGRVPFEKDIERLYRTGRYHTKHETHRAMLQDPTLRLVKSSARALLWHRDKLPTTKQERCEETILMHVLQRRKQQPETIVSVHDITDELLHELAHMETDRPNQYYISTSDLVTQQRLMKSSSTTPQIMENKELSKDTNDDRKVSSSSSSDIDMDIGMDDHAIEEFVRQWRRLFIDTLQPQFLPIGWSIDNPVTNDDG
jgi:hypothetical protein